MSQEKIKIEAMMSEIADKHTNYNHLKKWLYSNKFTYNEYDENDYVNAFKFMIYFKIGVKEYRLTNYITCKRNLIRHYELLEIIVINMLDLMFKNEYLINKVEMSKLYDKFDEELKLPSLYGKKKNKL